MNECCNSYKIKWLVSQNRPTKRAPDVWDSAAFSGIFLASSFFCSQALSTPAHTQVTQTVSVPLRVKPLGLFQKLSFGQVRFESSKSGFGF